MPPRHAYWTILIDNQPTAFRAHDPEELLPTLNRLREKNETAVMKWFERGQLFDTRDAARQAGLGRGERRWEGPRPDRPGTPRDKDWRPGGEHRDPRQKYKDAKKAKWTRFKQKIRERHEERVPRDPESFTPPHGDKLRPREDRNRREWRDDRERARTDRTDRDGRPSRPHGDKYRSRDQWSGGGDARQPQRPPRPRGDDPRAKPGPRFDREQRNSSRGAAKPSGTGPRGGFKKKPFTRKPSRPPRRRRDEDE